MKKLLGLLGVFAISASASTSVIACKSGNPLSVGEIDTTLTKLNGVSKDLILSKKDYATFTNTNTKEEDKYYILIWALYEIYQSSSEEPPIESDRTMLDYILRTGYAEFGVAWVSNWINKANEFIDEISEISNSKAIDSNKVKNFTQFFEAFEIFLKIDGIRDFFISYMEWTLDFETDVEKTSYKDEQKNKGIENSSQKIFVIEMDTINEEKEVVLYSVSIKFSGNVPKLNYKGGMILNIVEGTE